MKIEVYGKCILAGEHAVVRGKRALVTPLRSRSLVLRATRTSGKTVEVEECPLADPLTQVLSKAREKHAVPAGGWLLSATSNIPPRAGLGSSAALSVALARFLNAPDLFATALELENIFHGQSSGIDLAAVLSDGPILFTRGQPPEKLDVQWKPHLYLADTGLRSSTKECVEKVAALSRPDLDLAMEECALGLEHALYLEDEETFARYLEKAAGIFRDWGLIPGQVEAQMQDWKKKGALAVKPTGSGNGGFLLTLWKSPPPTSEKLLSIWDSAEAL